MEGNLWNQIWKLGLAFLLFASLVWFFVPSMYPPQKRSRLKAT